MNHTKVAILRCASQSSEARIIERTQEAIRLLNGWEKPFLNARRIAIKINAGVNRLVLSEGRQTEVTEPAVVEAVIGCIRSATDAEIVVGDAPTYGDSEEIYGSLDYWRRLAPYPNVRLLDFGTGDMAEMEMVHPSSMFRRYTMHQALVESDVFVSISKMKAHVATGFTLCMKNLFGWLPPSVYGSPRTYLHDRLIRLPRVIADLACSMRPCLNVVDGIAAANMSEWHGQPLHPELVVAGTDIVAVDHAGALVMGFDPRSDYPAHPYFYRRNYVRLAAEMGVGTNTCDEIEYLGFNPVEVATPFTVKRYGGDTRRNEQLRRGADCVAQYRAIQDDLAQLHRGRLLALDDGKPLWHGEDMDEMRRLERESGRDWRNAPQLIIHSLPADEEIENLDLYEVDADYQIGCT